MLSHLLKHIRSNAVAYVALFIALGGSSYAAVDLPRGSVGTKQLRNEAVTSTKLANGAITPRKLDRKAFGGSVVHWAVVSAGGAVESSSSKARVIGAPEHGGYVISWADTFSPRCAVIATPVGSGALVGPASGFADAHIAGAHPTEVWLDTYNASGQPTAAAFSVAVIC